MIVSGRLVAEASFGGRTLDGRPDRWDIVARIDSRGVMQWARILPLTDFRYAYRPYVATTPSGEVWIAGVYRREITKDQAVGLGSGGRGTRKRAANTVREIVPRGYVAYLARDGEVLSARSIGGRGDAVVDGLVLAADGDPILWGRFGGVVTFGGQELKAQEVDSRHCQCSDSDCRRVPQPFVVRLDQQGQLRWQRSVQGLRVLAAPGPRGFTATAWWVALEYETEDECLGVARARSVLELWDRDGQPKWRRPLDGLRVTAIGTRNGNQLSVVVGRRNDLFATFLNYAPKPWQHFSLGAENASRAD